LEKQLSNLKLKKKEKELGFFDLLNGNLIQEIQKAREDPLNYAKTKLLKRVLVAIFTNCLPVLFKMYVPQMAPFIGSFAEKKFFRPLAEKLSNVIINAISKKK